MANGRGDRMRVLLDLTRWEDQELDISGKFNARVGDTQDLLPLWIQDNAFPVNLRGWKVAYGGTDPQMVPHYHQANIDDLKSYRGDQQTVGKFTLAFDSRTFNIPGEWNQFYIRFIDDKDNTISTVDLSFHVFDDTFIAHAGDAEDSYVEQFERILQRVSKEGDQMEDQLREWLAKYKQSLLDAIHEVNDPKDGLYVRYQQLLDMTKQIQTTLKAAQFHDRIFQYKTVQEMKDAIMPLPGDMAATQGWVDSDDARGGFWRIRVKRDGEVPDGTNRILLNTGYVAERNYGIVQDMEPIHMGTVTYECTDDANGFLDTMPPVHMYVSKYGAGIAQVDVDEAGGSDVSEVKVQPIFSGNKCEIYISPADIRYRMPDMNLETPTSADCDGPNVYVVSNIYTLTLSLKSAKALSFTIDKNFITEYKDLMITLN